MSTGGSRRVLLEPSLPSAPRGLSSQLPESFPMEVLNRHTQSKRKYNVDEKKQLLDNLDLEGSPDARAFGGPPTLTFLQWPTVHESSKDVWRMLLSRFGYVKKASFHAFRVSFAT